MRKKILLSMFLLLLFSFTANKAYVYAADTSDLTAKTEITGDIKKGSKIKITISLNKIESLYAADIWLKYDKSLIKVTNMEKGTIISDSSVQTFQVVNKFDNNTGSARLEFSCLGKINGFSGQGSLLILDAEVLKDGSLNINSKPFVKEPDNNYNLKLQLVNKDVKELNFEYINSGQKTADENNNQNTQNTNESNVQSNNNNQNTAEVNTSNSNVQGKSDDRTNSGDGKTDKTTSLSSDKQKGKTLNVNKPIYTYAVGGILVIITIGIIYYKKRASHLGKKVN